MRRIFLHAVPLFVAAVALVLASPVLRAQQVHDHTSVAPASACCGNSGSSAMNHAAGGGCCDKMPAAQGGKDATDHTAMNHEPAQSTAKPDEPAMDHGAGGGCCANMKMEHSAEGGCCENMKMDHGSGGADAKLMDHGAGSGCCGNMAKGKVEASAKADSSTMACRK